MRKKMILAVLCFLLLVSLVAIPVIAATVSCPSTCSCLLPAEAKKLGYAGYCGGKQNLCGYDAQKNEKYCYEKAVTTAPFLVVPLKPAVTMITSTVTSTAAPSLSSQCPAGCFCMKSEDSKVKGLAHCSGKQVICGYDKDSFPLYCFSQQVGTPVTPPPITTDVTLMPEIQATITGLSLPAGAVSAAGTGQPAATTSPAQPLSAISGAAYLESTARQEPSGSVFAGFMAVVMDFFGSLFGPGSSSAVESGVMRQCGPLQIPCDGTCTSVVSDEENCGSCGNRCPIFYDCCAGQCTDARTDVSNCGRCGVTCPAGQLCIMSNCRDTSSDDRYCGNPPENCPVFWKCCGGTCKDSRNDERNCGGCDITCASGQTCCNGRCTDLASDWFNCGNCGESCNRINGCCSGTCRDLFADESNCGTCRNACHAGETCCNGRCADLASDAHHCGTCGGWCPPDDNPSKTSCCEGKCVDYDSDWANCGSCGNQCQPMGGCLYGRCRTREELLVREECHERYMRNEISWDEWRACDA